MLIHISATKGYSARSKAYLPRIGTVDERAIVQTIKNPDSAFERVQKEAEAAEDHQPNAGAYRRAAGMAAGAVAGGVLIWVAGRYGIIFS